MPSSWRGLLERAGFIHPEHAPSSDCPSGVLRSAEDAVHPEVLEHIMSLAEDLRAAQVHQAEFIRGLGHDLKSPLSSVLRLSESLAAGDFGALTPAQLESMQLMIQAIQHLTAQAEALYAVGEVWTGSREQSVAVDINQAVERITAVAMPHLREKGVEFVTHLDPTEPTVIAWPGVVERILGNIIQNAIRYTERGMVSVLVQQHERCVSVVVADTGIGIPADEIPLIGQHRVRGSNAVGIAGSGAGMAVVGHLLDGLGGAMSIESNVGIGTTVTVRIPLEPGAGVSCAEESA